MKTYYEAFGRWYGGEALLRICDTMEEAKAAIYKAATEKKKSKNEYDPTIIYIISLLRPFRGGK